MSKFPLSDEQVLAIVDSEEIDGEDFDTLYEHYTSNGEMPYGTAKARDGDPDQWIFAQLVQRARFLKRHLDSVGLGETVSNFEISQGGITIRGSGDAGAAAAHLNRVITELDLDDGNGVGLLPAFHDENEDRAPLGKEYETSAEWAADAKAKGIDQRIIDFVERTTEALSGFTVHDVPVAHFEFEEGFSPSKRVRDAVLETLADRAANPVQIPLGFIVADTGNKK